MKIASFKQLVSRNMWSLAIVLVGMKVMTIGWESMGEGGLDGL